MEEAKPSNASKIRSLMEIDFPPGDGPVAHAVRFLDPRDVAAHFAALNIKCASPEERWARKAHATSFPGVWADQVRDKTKCGEEEAPTV
jgi:hypothetical protein